MSVITLYNDIIKYIVSMKCKETYWFFHGHCLLPVTRTFTKYVQRNMLNMHVNVKEVEHEWRIQIPACHVVHSLPRW